MGLNGDDERASLQHLQRVSMGRISFATTSLGQGILVALEDVRSHLMHGVRDPNSDDILNFLLMYKVILPNLGAVEVGERFFFLSTHEMKLQRSSIMPPDSHIDDEPVPMFQIDQQPSHCSANKYNKELLDDTKALTGTIRSLPSGCTVMAFGGVFREIQPIGVIQKARQPQLFASIPRDVTFTTALGESLEYNRDILAFYGVSEPLLAHEESTADGTVYLIKKTPAELQECLIEAVAMKGTDSLSYMANCDVIVGVYKAVIRVNRSVLAMQNVALCRLAFGTSTLPVDTSKPIELCDLNAIALKIVLEALILLQTHPVKVPHGLESHVCNFLDYIDLSPNQVSLCFGDGFRRGNLEWSLGNYDESVVSVVGAYSSTLMVMIDPQPGKFSANEFKELLSVARALTGSSTSCLLASWSRLLSVTI